MVSAGRSPTVAFRISLEERALIDAHAGALGVSNSEYSRRVIVGAARVDARAGVEEKESRRAEIWPPVNELQAQVAQARSWTGEFRREVQRLQGELSQWSDDVVAAASEVLAGDASAQVKLAITWSRVEYRQRLRVLPIVAGLVSGAFEQVAGKSPITIETAYIGAAFLQRVLWLIEALDCDGGEYNVRTRKDGPIEKVFNRIASEMAQRLELPKPESGETTVAGQTSVDDGGFEWV
jgi:hypothetical protein